MGEFALHEWHYNKFVIFKRKREETGILVLTLDQPVSDHMALQMSLNLSHSFHTREEE